MKKNKLLGQNFLNSKKIIEDILHAGEIKSDDIVLEVGPGKGTLTEGLLERAKKVIAVEKDERLVEFLREKFADEIKKGKLILIQDDILKISDKKLGIKNDKYKIIANIPYYITSHFLRNFLETDCQPSMMVLMAQKEVAKRIAVDKESVLSISVKVYGEPKIIKTVPAKYFSPKPKVDSAILKISNINKDFFKKLSTEKFFELVKKGFKQKRKMLKNNLKCDVEILEKCKIPEKERAENLSLEDWRCLFKIK